MKQELCRLVNVAVIENNDPLLQQIDLYILRGERIALIGLHGSGKSILAKVIAGLKPHSSGTIFWGGKERARSHSRKLQQGCFYIHSDSMLVPALSVVDNLVALGRNGRFWYNKKRAMELAREIFFKLGVAIDPSMRAAQLTSLQAIVVQIAKAVYNASQFVIVDASQQTLVAEEIGVLQKVMERCEEQTFLYVTNADDAISQQCDRVVVMQSRRISGVLFKGYYDSERLTRYITGHYDSSAFKKSKPPNRIATAQKTVLQIDDMHQLSPRIFPLGLTVNAGEIVGLVDTTKYIGGIFLSALTSRAYQQNVHVDGITVENYRQAVKAGLGSMNLQDFKSYQFNCFGPEENLTFQTLRKISNRGFIDEKIREFVYRRYGGKISHTNYSDSERWSRLQMMYYRWIASSPKVLVLDFMIRGLHPLCQQAFIHMLEETAGNGIGILLVSNELAGCYHVCNRIYILNQNTYSLHVKGNGTTHE